MNLPFLPYGRQLIDEDDIAAVTAVLRSDCLTTGPTVQAFEQAFADKVGARHAVACNSGTAALHLAALALGLGPGDIAVVPSVTFLSSANCARFVGADVVFADVDPETGLITPETARAALDRAGSAAKMLVVVQLNGQICDIEGIAALAKERGVAVVEDACHALGTTYTESDGTIETVGSCRHSALSCFSFHPLKTIAMGEGGAVTTNDPAFCETAGDLRTHGMVRDPERFRNSTLGFDADGVANPWYYEMLGLGFNFRVSDINCALGLSQLGKLDRFAARRRGLAARYTERLADFAPRLKPLTRRPNCDPAWHLYVVQIDFVASGNKDRARVMRELRAHGIGTQVHYIPVHRQPYYVDLYGEEDLPGADAYYRSALSLPLSPTMADDDVDRVVAALSDVLRV